jgi:peptide deformylase
MGKVLPLALMGAPSLYEVASPVDLAKLEEVQEHVENMITTLDHLGERVGLAAPQVFIPLRIVIFRVPLSAHSRYSAYVDKEIPLTVMINPEIIPLSPEKEKGWEACISVPGMMGEVERFTRIRYKYYDSEGKFHDEEARGFHARLIQHECDHLDGILYPMKLTSIKAFGAESEIIKIMHAK